MLACQYYAYTLTQASYVIAVKRLSLIIGIMYGGIFFKEIHIRTEWQRRNAIRP